MDDFVDAVIDEMIAEEGRLRLRRRLGCLALVLLAVGAAALVAVLT